MPYTEQSRRYTVTADNPEATVGDLTYLLSALVERYRQAHGDSFQTFAEIIAALDCTADEFRERVVHPYELQKLIQNGPVFAGPLMPPRDPVQLPEGWA